MLRLPRTALRRGSLAVIAAITLASRAPAQSPDTTHYTALFTGRPAGFMTVWRSPGTERYVFEYNDRGRGPHLQEMVAIDPHAVPTKIEVDGHDYLKDSVRERFGVGADGAASWTNTVEGSGGAPAAAGKFYLSAAGTPAELALLARAMLAAPDHKVALLPAGEATIDRVLSRDVTIGGSSVRATLYAISGLAFSPIYLWLDDNAQLMGSVSSWFTIVRGGAEDGVPALLKVQDSVSSTRYTALARSLAHPVPSGTALVIRDGSLFDAEHARLVPHQTVVIEGDRIRAVGPTTSVAVPAGAKVIDASGKTVMPGLWDMHVHIQPGDDGLLHIAAGVTSARDMGNDTTTVLMLRARIDSGVLIGPRLVLAGLIDSPGPYQVPTGVLANTEPEVRAAVDRYAALGFEQIKVYSSMKPELVPAIIEEAHGKGLRVSGHVPAYMTAEQVVKLGFDEVQHVNFLMLNFMDTVKDTRSMARFTAVAQDGATLDFSSPRVRSFLKLLVDRHTVIDPTVGTFEDMFLARPGHISSSYGMVADRFPAQVRRGLYGGGLPVPNGMDDRYRASYAAMLRMVLEAYRAGVTIVPGTDALPGFGLHRELELYVQAGIPAPNVLRMATLGAARVMKHDDQRGSIAPGKQADVIIVAGDPTQRISDIRKVETVVKGGVLYTPAELYRALGITP